MVRQGISCLAAHQGRMGSHCQHCLHLVDRHLLADQMVLHHQVTWGLQGRRASFQLDRQITSVTHRCDRQEDHQTTGDDLILIIIHIGAHTDLPDHLATRIREATQAILQVTVHRLVGTVLARMVIQVVLLRRFKAQVVTTNKGRQPDHPAPLLRQRLRGSRLQAPGIGAQAVGAVTRTAPTVTHPHPPGRLPSIMEVQLCGATYLPEQSENSVLASCAWLQQMQSYRKAYHFAHRRHR